MTEKERVQEAFAAGVRIVMTELPNKHADRQQVLLNTLAPLLRLPISLPTAEAKKALCALVRLSPLYWGTQRKKQYWSIVLYALPHDEAIELYLQQFPPDITLNQHRSLGRVLTEFHHMSDVAAEELLARFQIREPSHNCSDCIRPYTEEVP